MTTTYDPAEPAYLVDADLRQEMDRVFDLCHGCRLCFNLCPSFSTLFDLIDDAHDGNATSLTDGEKDRVVDECYQCKLCYLKCPYVPPHEWALDFPRLMMRAHAVDHRSTGRPLRERLADQFLGRTDLIGRFSSLGAPVVNAITGARGGLARKAMEATVGIHSERMLPPYARERFSSWFKRHPRAAIESPRAEVSVFPTCFNEYMEPGVGKDLVRVCEHNEFACSLPASARCCGAPWLHSGDIARFEASAHHNVEVLAAEIRAGREVLVAQPTCAYVIKRDYPIYAPGPDADLVAAHTFDATEFLMNEHRSLEGGLKADFPGAVPESVTYHLACHLRAQYTGPKGRDLLKLTGTEVVLVERCSGIDGTWGYRRENYELAKKVARPLTREIEAAGGEVICGDCHLANTAIFEETGRRPSHPVQILARAYGLPDD